MRSLFAIVALAAVARSAAWRDNKRDNAVLLEKVTALTLKQGRFTNGRRSAPVPQLNCVGGDACGRYTPSVVQCRNVGFDGYDVQWKCQADLPEAYRFGTTDVTCEGFQNPDDPYILKGSCGLEYTLYLTGVGTGNGQSEWRDTHNDQGTYSSRSHHDRYSSHTRSSSSSFGRWMMYAMVAGLFMFLFGKSVLRCLFGTGGAGYNGGGGGGAAGFAGGRDYNDNGGGGGFGGYGGPRCGNPYQPGYNRRGGGFWNGLGLGGMAGYFMGSRNRGREYYGYEQPRHYREPRYHSTGPRFSAGSGTTRRTTSSPGSSTRTASGFGSTRRR